MAGIRAGNLILASHLSEPRGMDKTCTENLTPNDEVGVFVQLCKFIKVESAGEDGRLLTASGEEVSRVL